MGGVLADTQIRELVRIEPFSEAQKREGRISYGLSSYGYDVRVGTRFRIFTPTPASGDIAVVDPKRFSEEMMVEVDVGRAGVSPAYEGMAPGGAGVSPAHEGPAHTTNGRGQDAPSNGSWRGHDAPSPEAGGGSEARSPNGKGKNSVIIPPNSFALCETVEFIEVPRDVLVICVGKSTYARCGIIVNVTPLEPEWRGRVTLEISNTTPLPARIYANEGIAQLVFLKADRVCSTSYADKAGKYQDQEGLTLPRVD